MLTLLALGAMVAWGLHEIRRVDRTIEEIGERRPEEDQERKPERERPS